MHGVPDDRATRPRPPTSGDPRPGPRCCRSRKPDPACRVRPVPAGLGRRLRHLLTRLLELGVRPHHRKPTVAELPRPSERTRFGRPEPHRDRTLDRQRRNPGTRHRVIAAGEGDARLGPQFAHQLDLLVGALASGRKSLSQSLILDGIPAEADPEAQSSAAEQVDLGRLLGDENGLSLGQNH